MREAVYKIAPHFLQNLLVTLYNYLSNKVRYRGKYAQFRNEFLNNRSLTLQELQTIQKEKYSSFLKYAVSNSPYYKNLYKNIKEFQELSAISKLPIVNKEDLRASLNLIYTINKSEAVVSKTGGTTGKSLEVYFTPQDFQERIAMLDTFRSNFGYELGKKTAWFSGKNILTKRDLKKKRFWKKDYLYNVKYYSTFHIKKDYLSYYIADLLKFQPEYIVGFPSNILEIAKYGLATNTSFPSGIVRAIFPTAESITDTNKQIITSYFHCGVYDQYASSEGAPFIIECKNRKLHLEMQSGVFEVLDLNNNPAKMGRLVVTSFTTQGTPLIRYDIGDSIELSDDSCTCGNNNPLVKQILGRIDDYIYSPERGKINLGNISNTLKDTQGIIKFQAIQNELNSVLIKLIVDEQNFNEKSKRKFLNNWVDRVGPQMQIQVEFVTEIPVEKSGKFRIVKNNIKHLIES